MNRSQPWKPTKAQLVAARGKHIRDIIAADLKVLFCGINPGLYSGAVGHHFARPGNRFWPALHAGGFTATVLSPFDERQLLALGYGITNLVRRATATAQELSDDEIVAGARGLARKVRRYRPAIVAILGIGAYRTAFQRPKASLGSQSEKLADAKIWVLPNPSGLNAHFQLAELAKMFRRLRESC